MGRYNKESSHGGQNRAIYDNAPISKCIQIGNTCDPQRKHYGESDANSGMHTPVFFGTLVDRKKHKDTDRKHCISDHIAKPAKAIKNITRAQCKD